MADFGKFKNPFSTSQQQYIPPKFTGNKKPILNTVSNNQKSSFNSLKGNNPFGSFNTSEPAASTVLGLGNSDAINQIANNNAGFKDVMNKVNSNGLGFGTSSVDEYLKKSGKIESNNKFDAVNKKTGAYGQWQVLPKYQKYYADKAGLTVEQSKAPEGQIKVAKTIYDDTTKYLDSKGYDKTDRNRYLVHQQGRQGFNDLMQGKYDPQALAANIPTDFLMNAPEKEDIKDTYFRYWDKKLANF